MGYKKAQDALAASAAVRHTGVYRGRNPLHPEKGSQ